MYGERSPFESIAIAGAALVGGAALITAGICAEEGVVDGLLPAAHVHKQVVQLEERKPSDSTPTNQQLTYYKKHDGLETDLNNDIAIFETGLEGVTFFSVVGAPFLGFATIRLRRRIY